MQFDDGEIYVVNYIVDDSPKAFIKGYSFRAEEFLIYAVWGKSSFPAENPISHDKQRQKRHLLYFPQGKSENAFLCVLARYLKILRPIGLRGPPPLIIIPQKAAFGGVKPSAA